MKYGYNIKGAITKINDPDALGDDLFAMNIFYDTPINNNVVYNDGKISAIQWNSQNLIQAKTYMYEYDDLNRLTKATFAPGNQYDVENISYDLNGNITHLARKGEVITKYSSGSQIKDINPPIVIKTYELIDDLSYIYGGNKVKRVSDAIPDVESELDNDFKDYFNDEIPDAREYFYDANGNMTKDINKGIELVTYNHLNQLIDVLMKNKNRTIYTYTATGLKLKTEVFEEDKMSNTTDYSGAYVYVNNELSFTNIPASRSLAFA